MTIKRILVPTDFSADAEAAFWFAVDLARQLGPSIHLLHVVDTGDGGGASSSLCDSDEIAGMQVNLLGDARKRLRLAIATARGSRIVFEHDARIGSPTRAIFEYAREHQIDLIVMGTAGRAAVAPFVTGGVTERVVRMAPCAVLTLRADRPALAQTGDEAMAHT